MTGERARFSVRERSVTNSRSSQRNLPPEKFERKSMASSQIFTNKNEFFDEENIPLEKEKLQEIENEKKKLEKMLNEEKQKNILLKSRISQFNFDMFEEPQISTEYLSNSTELEEMMFKNNDFPEKNVKNFLKNDKNTENDDIYDLITNIEEKSLGFLNISEEMKTSDKLNASEGKTKKFDTTNNAEIDFTEKIKKLEFLLGEERKEKHLAVVSLQQNNLLVDKLKKESESLRLQLENSDQFYSQKQKQQSEYLQSIIDTTRQKIQS
jgi:hypothetical protein